MRRLMTTLIMLAFPSMVAAQECERLDPSDLSDLAYAAWRDIDTNFFAIEDSPVERDRILSTCNRFISLHIDGPDIFSAAREIISRAEHEVDMVFFEWESETVLADRLIGDGLIAAQARRTPDDPLLVRIIRDDVGRTSLGRAVNELYDSQKEWMVQGLDTSRVEIQLGTAPRSTQIASNLHDKYIIVDGKYLLITGANVQPNNDPETLWHDSGYVLEGDVALSALSAFERTWNDKKANHWECRPQSFSRQCDKRRHFPPPDQSWMEPFGSRHPGDVPVLAVGKLKNRALFSNNTNNPQDVAWLALMKNAASHIFIETPNINDDAFRFAVLDAVRRGVTVRLITGLGFNDAAMDLPGLGGSNLEVVGNLRKKIRALAPRDPETWELFQLRWYGKDGREPVTDNGKGASHTKYMSVDSRVAMVGSGNQDTISWNFSQEFNVLIDDEAATSDIETALFRPDWSASVGSYVELYEGNGGTQDVVCPIAVKNNRVQKFGDFNIRLEDTWRCDNDEAKSLLLHDVDAGKVLRFYDDRDIHFPQRDDWIEIVVKRPVARKYIDTFEKSFEDDDVSVIYHRDDGLDGKLSAAEVSTSTIGPVLDLYDGNGGTKSLVCSILGRTRTIDLKLDPYCGNDRARSLILSNFPADKAVFVYDDPGGSTNDDWAVIVPRRAISRATVGSFETSVENADFELCNFPDNGLDGKVSRIRIGALDEAAGLCGEPPAPTVTYTVAPQPSDIYPDSGGELTDGITSTGIDWVNALGWLHVDPTITLDLGAVQLIDDVQLYVGNSFNNGSFGVARPANVVVSISSDGVSWTSAGSLSFSVWSAASTKWQVDLGMKTVGLMGRWVRLAVTRGGPWTMAMEISVNDDPVGGDNPLVCDGIGDGIWDGCRGTGCSVCAEKLVGFDCYFENHPTCILNTDCQGRFFSCDAACPPPSEADRCSS